MQALKALIEQSEDKRSQGGNRLAAKFQELLEREQFGDIERIINVRVVCIAMTALRIIVGLHRL